MDIVFLFLLFTEVSPLSDRGYFFDHFKYFDSNAKYSHFLFNDGQDWKLKRQSLGTAQLNFKFKLRFKTCSSRGLRILTLPHFALRIRITATKKNEYMSTFKCFIGPPSNCFFRAMTDTRKRSRFCRKWMLTADKSTQSLQYPPSVITIL